jgi:hypothetical protein
LSSAIPLSQQRPLLLLYIDTFEKIIAYAKGHKDIWFARRGDIAAWARKYYESKM